MKLVIEKTPYFHFKFICKNRLIRVCLGILSISLWKI